MDADQISVRGLSESKNPPLFRISLVVLCLVAFGLRLGPLWVNRFHSDEALYASWALAIVNGRDMLLAQAAPDKPPLLFYLMAVAFLILGRIEVAARLVGLMAGVISVALMWRLAGGVRIPPHVPTITMALSPFAILFSPTGFLDPLMMMFVLASLVAAMRRRPGWAGVFLGLAAATKVQALVFLPLVIGLGALTHALPDPTLKRRAKSSSLLKQALGTSLRFAAGLTTLVGIVLVWDRLRGGTPFWIQQTINYGGIRLIYASEVMPRLIGWANFLPHFFGWPMLIALVVGLPLLLMDDLTRHARTASATLDLALLAFALGYFCLHWLLAFPVWDRYIFGLVPVICLLVGRWTSWLVGWLEKRVRLQTANLITGALILSLMIAPATQAFQSELPVGGDHGPHDGIDRVADYLRGFPYGTVVYDHWQGWTLRYYLWDAQVYIAYFATPGSLGEDLHVFGRTSARLIVFPSNESTTRIESAIAAEGFALSPVLSTQDRHGQATFTVYRIDYIANH